MLQQQEEQRREQQAKQASQLAAQQTQQRLKQQLMQQRQRMMAQQQQMKQKQIEQQQQQAQHAAIPAPVKEATPSLLDFPSTLPSAVESTPLVADAERAHGRSSTQQQPTAAVDSADSETNAAHASSNEEGRDSSPGTPPPHSAVPHTDVAPPSLPSALIVPISSVPVVTSLLPSPPTPVPFLSSLPILPLPVDSAPSVTVSPFPPASTINSVLVLPAAAASPSAPLPLFVPPPPSDPTLVLAIDRLAQFVHRNAQFEQVIRTKHPQHAPGMFAFLYDETSDDYQYYRWRRQELAYAQREEDTAQVESFTEVAARRADADGEQDAAAFKRRDTHPLAAERQMTDAAQLEEADVDGVPLEASESSHSSLAAMDQFIHRLSSTDTANQRKHIPDASSHSITHDTTYMSAEADDAYSDYTLPDRFFSRHSRHSNTSRSAIAALTHSKRIDDSNVGFKLLSKMGWKGGEGLGKDGRKGRVEPVVAHTGAQTAGGGLGRKEEVKGKKRKQISRPQVELDGGEESDGEEDGGDVEDEDGSGQGFVDVYASYKRQMSAKYQHRPNPLNNPRRPY